MPTKLTLIALAATIGLTGCATQPQGKQSAAETTPMAASSTSASTPQAPATPAVAPVTAASNSTSAALPEIKLDVTYTTRLNNDSRLKQTPEEVFIVRPKNTQSNVAAQAALNVALFALGGLSFKTFGKDELKGDKLEDVKDRNNVRNPVATDYITQLSKEIHSTLQSNTELKTRVFKNSLMVGGGNIKLIYEGLTGEEANLFKMSTELNVYKRKENLVMFTNPLVEVSCNRASEKALPLEQWAADDYVMVRRWVQETLDQCSKKVIAALPQLLAN